MGEASMRLALILSSISAGLWIWMACLIDSEPWGDTPSASDLLVALLYLPNLFLAFCCLIYAIVKLADKQQRGNALVVLALSCITPAWGSYEVLHPKWQRDENQWEAQQAKLAEWQQLGSAVNPLLRDYYRTYPAKFRFPHNDGEAEIEGFVEYASGHGIRLKEDKIVDPWGDPVHFVIAHNGETALVARNQFYAVADQVPDKTAVGLLLDNPGHVDSGSCQQWAVQNGYISIRTRY
jgi:hypothetical protein